MWAVLTEEGTPFYLRHAWYGNYLTQLAAQPQQLHFFVMREQGMPIAILPLRLGGERLRGLPVRVLELPSDPQMSIADIVAAPGRLDARAAQALVNTLHQNRLAWDVMRFQAVTEKSAALAWAASWPRALIAEARYRDYISSDRPYTDVLASFSKNFRASLRKARNKLRTTEGVTRRRAQALPDLEHAFKRFCDVEAAGWKGERGTAIKNDARVRAFYRGIMRDFGSQQQCEINILSIKDQPVAGQFCLRAGATLHVLKIGYDEHYAKLSPGNLLLEDLLEECPQRGIKEVDLVTDAAWHTAWNPNRERVFEVMIFNGTARGRAAYWAIKAKRGLASRLAVGASTTAGGS